MDEQVNAALRRVRYKVMTNNHDLESVYRLRYKCYRAERSIIRNQRKLMTDPYDDAPNCVHVGVEIDEEIMASVRLHLVSKLCATSPTLDVFPEIAERVRCGETALDPTRFVVDPFARKNRIPLHFLTLRIPFLAAMFYDIDLALAPVRKEHAAFYRRYLGYKVETQPRRYPRLKSPIQLLTANFQEQRDAVLARTPVFGPIEDLPNASVAFPELPGVYTTSKAA